jgi:hypothetical protein
MSTTRCNPLPVGCLSSDLSLEGNSMKKRSAKLTILLIAVAGFVLVTLTSQTSANNNAPLDRELASVLEQHGFTGGIGYTLEQRLGR